MTESHLSVIEAMATPPSSLDCTVVGDSHEIHGRVTWAEP